MSRVPGPTPAGDVTACRDLAETLDLLAEAFLVPGADVRDRAATLAARAGLATPALAAVAVSLRTLADADADELGVEYVRLFLHGRPVTVHPYESFYRSGTLADEEAAADLRELFAAAGVGPERGASAPLDHLGLELDLLALLLHGLAAGDAATRDAVAGLAAGLVRDHLRDFTTAFRACLEGALPAPYYRAAADVLRHAVDAADRLLAGNGGPRPHDANIASAVPAALPAEPVRSEELPLERPQGG